MLQKIQSKIPPPQYYANYQRPVRAKIAAIAAGAAEEVLNIESPSL
jgi:hypothetical protein